MRLLDSLEEKKPSAKVVNDPLPPSPPTVSSKNVAACCNEGGDIIALNTVVVTQSRKCKRGKKKAQQMISMDLRYPPPNKYTQDERGNGCVFLSLASALAYTGDHRPPQSLVQNVKNRGHGQST